MPFTKTKDGLHTKYTICMMASFYFCDQNPFCFFFSYLNFGNPIVDCKTVVFFLKISKEIGKVWRVPDFPDRVELKENVRVAGFLFPGTKQTIQNNDVSILSGFP